MDQRQGGDRALLSDAQLQDVHDKPQGYRPVAVPGLNRVATASGQHWTVPDLAWALQQGHDIVYRSNNSYRALFHRCGFSYQWSAKLFRSLSAVQVAEFEEMVLTTYPDVPILLLWDRAIWHGGPAARALLTAHPRLEVMRFPTAAPDLNLQESGRFLFQY